MAELDFSLPGLQARFLLEILRRRRWLIVPLAVLGLGVGAMVSLMIPRYYRAETRVEIKDMSLEGRPVPKAGEDPMAGIVENARYTLANPKMILRAARALKWPEFFTADPADPGLRARIASVLGRVQVYPIRSGDTPGAGGILGILFGLGLGKLVQVLTPLPSHVPFWAFASALAVSAGVGLFFGIWPAVRASRLDPVEALRYE